MVTALEVFLIVLALAAGVSMVLIVWLGGESEEGHR